MNYGALLNNGQQIDMNYGRYAGWYEGSLEKQFFSANTISLISNVVSKLTKGVDKQNRTIVVPKERIVEVMNGVYQRYTPPVGDIFTRFSIAVNDERDSYKSMVDQTIEIIVNNIVNQLGIEEGNFTLDAWVQVYGDFNTSGLRAHPQIKTLDKRPSTMQFNMNY